MNVVVTINANCTASPDPATVNRLNNDQLQWRTSAGQFLVEFASASPFVQKKFNVATGSVTTAGPANATASGTYKYNVTNLATGTVNDPGVLIRP